MNNYEAKQERRRERYLRKSDILNQRSDTLYKEGKEALAIIPLGQPMMPDHYSYRSDLNYRTKNRRKMEKAFELSKSADHYRRKAESVGTGGISSDDEDVIAKLEQKLYKLEDAQVRAKEANAEARKAGLPVPYPAFTLTNNGARIRATKRRIEQLTKIRESEPREPIQGDGWQMVESIGDNRIKFIFDAKPDETTRTLLKQHGFKWSRYATAWVRKLTPNARYTTNRLIEKLVTA